MKKRGRQVGEIRIRNTERGVAYPVIEGVTNIPAWSRGASPWCDLSPFKIGPVKFEEDGEMKTCRTFETWWQSFKVWPRVDKQQQWCWRWSAVDHIDKDDLKNKPKEELVPNNAWTHWHNTLLKNDKPVRRPNGRAIPLFAWWQGRRLDVIQARKELYIPYLQKLYREHPTYKRLLEMVSVEGKDICIIEPDGPRSEYFKDGLVVNMSLLRKLQTVTEMRHFPGTEGKGGSRYVPYGHGYVLALTLLEDMN